MTASKVYAKYSVRIDDFHQIGYSIQDLMRHALYGRPGGVYLEIPREIIEGDLPSSMDTTILSRIPAPPLPIPSRPDIDRAADLILKAKRPLVIIGKGAAYSHAEKELLNLVDLLNLPFLPSPMGKGVIPDSHPNNASPARSFVIAEADIIVLVGARLNWIFEFGEKFNKHSRIIQIDIAEEEIHHNVTAAIGLCGDARAIVDQLVHSVKTFKASKDRDEVESVRQDAMKNWHLDISIRTKSNFQSLKEKCNDNSSPLKYHYVLDTLKSLLPRDAVIVNEGANTMDVGRIVLQSEVPRSRLDAGTLGTMGLGTGYAIAAAIAHPDRKVVAILGDSAFGFSGFEIETACRYGLPITYIILNNNGIYSGHNALPLHPDPSELSPRDLTPNSKYHFLAEAFGGVPFLISEPEKLKGQLKEALDCERTCLVNIHTDTHGDDPQIVPHE